MAKGLFLGAIFAFIAAISNFSNYMKWRDKRKIQGIVSRLIDQKSLSGKTEQLNYEVLLNPRGVEKSCIYEEKKNKSDSSGIRIGSTEEFVWDEETDKVILGRDLEQFRKNAFMFPLLGVGCIVIVFLIGMLVAR